ncbi:unnamed protein product, partial [Chrysoparadoxa australica]
KILLSRELLRLNTWPYLTGTDSINFGRLLSELTGPPAAPVCIFEDNESAIALAQALIQDRH